MEICVDKSLKYESVDIKRVEDRIIMMNLMLGEESTNITSAYTLQVKLDDATKQHFWEHMNRLI